MGAKTSERTWLAIRRVIVVVFPDPAPASITTGPRTASTARRCSGLRSSKPAPGEPETIVADTSPSATREAGGGATRPGWSLACSTEHGEEPGLGIGVVDDLRTFRDHTTTPVLLLHCLEPLGARVDQLRI